MADKWTSGVITNSGISMLGEVMSGGELIVSRAALGGGTVEAAALMAQAELTQPLTVPVVIAQKKLIEGKGLDIRIQIRNTGVSAAQVMKQVGLFAKIGADGEEKLFSIMQDDVGDEIPSAASYPDFMLEFTAAVAVSNTGNISVTISSSKALVTFDDLEKALEEKVDSQDFLAHKNDESIHVTSQEKAGWNSLSSHNFAENPDFRINQRGKALYQNDSYSQYTVDRWFLQEWNTKLAVNDAGVKVELKSEGDSAIILRQTLYGFKPQYGKTYSLSVKHSGTVYSASGIINSVSDTPKEWMLNLISDHGAPLELEWVKLELGTRPTQFIAPDFSIELAKCQRYYQIRSTNDIAAVDLRPSMAAITDIVAVEGGYAYVAG